MSKRKQKFVLEGLTFSIGKLIIEHEAEHSQGDSLANNFRNAIGQAISGPMRLLSADTIEVANTPPSSAIDAPTKSRKRRRPLPKTSSRDGTEPVGRPQRSKSGGPRSLVEDLMTSGFFAQDRLVTDTRDELRTRGHTFESRAISSVLLAMTQQKQLVRKKDESDKWVYRAA